jgi:N-acetylmuramoyl-L-alanine amidase
MKEQLVLARTMYGEARGDGDTGMIAVGHVILNRVANPGWWGIDITSVALKPWQFSAWNHNDPNRDIISILQPHQGNWVFDRAYELAGRVLAGDLPDTTGGATHYHNQSVHPSWATGAIQTARIGGHSFFKGVA